MSLALVYLKLCEKRANRFVRNLSYPQHMLFNSGAFKSKSPTIVFPHEPFDTCEMIGGVLEPISQPRSYINHAAYELSNKGLDKDHIVTLGQAIGMAVIGAMQALLQERAFGAWSEMSLYFRAFECLIAFFLENRR
ncbi:hypothetical protein GUITHDRAFT_136319 [Guillardia theta CCMP2712]|uniref:Uncharacterized protein n=1 Tax=Guillardia theta (strain CCMP2712) TaxID=905079 RepID=L1JLT5_GUITC|nr:hypothetical protein GUITHDRAFT_136319 [Guillardia theta CCMP2712]EKX49159.1 hypothetical protein GUITHDRAFT_136319 [Guillardia theta CCMP2712]|eukprot:XP_005836139.1 hypothetical protein GUITHDRAFT_136319 [Guillardia theta CCMP2712]